MYNFGMSLNCNEINLILNELSIQGAFIQDIIQPGYDTLALYTYKSGIAKTVLICTAQNSCRINETRRKIIKNDKPLRFMEFLKSKIKGAKINSIEQIDLQRIVKMELSHADENFLLYIRLWSNAANVILCDSNNVILDSMFRRPKKNEVTGGTFIIPESDNSKPQKEWPIRDFSQVQEEFLQKHPDSLPLSFNQKVDLWYSEHASSLSREALLKQAEKWYTATHSRMTTALERLQQKLKDFENAEQYKHQGDLILSYSYLIDGKSKFIECEDYNTGKTVQILIDPKKSAHENASTYYEQYKKAQSGSEDLIHDIELSKKQIEKLDKLYASISCRAAIKANDKNSQPELETIVDILLNDPSIKYCPHGRPVSTTISKNKLERMFGRQQ